MQNGLAFIHASNNKGCWDRDLEDQNDEEEGADNDGGNGGAFVNRISERSVLEKPMHLFKHLILIAPI